MRHSPFAIALQISRNRLDPDPLDHAGPLALSRHLTITREHDSSAAAEPSPLPGLGINELEDCGKQRARLRLVAVLGASGTFPLSGLSKQLGIGPEWPCR